MAEQYPDSYYKTPFKFSGKEMDEETGLHYFGARYYDSRSSIWLSVDPLAENFPNFNPYAYCYQNPINIIDPTGTEGESVDNEYLVFTKNGQIQDVKYVSNKGGDKTDYVTVVNLDAPSVYKDYEGIDLKYEFDVEIEYTAGPPNNSETSQRAEPSPGSRLLHGKCTECAAYEFLIDRFTMGGSKASRTLYNQAKKEASKRVKSAGLRTEWENATGQSWPKEPKVLPDGRVNPYAGRNQTVSHKKALTDGGTNDLNNIEPMPWLLHHEMHKLKGDFKRWASRKKN
ncbi:RHS repeat-associated protein [Flavobacterium arsenatis]|uniref:RHS repeat-associated protein n=1 Tax=Flavobacterium arsenatis TaxID=1484332 RepID=A0ABU1TTR3_9FLAO|nr:RHS repeat-associated protein [Flavobacterium arsenatis]